MAIQYPGQYLAKRSAERKAAADLAEKERVKRETTRGEEFDRYHRERMQATGVSRRRGRMASYMKGKAEAAKRAAGKRSRALKGKTKGGRTGAAGIFGKRRAGGKAGVDWGRDMKHRTRGSYLRSQRRRQQAQASRRQAARGAYMTGQSDTMDYSGMAKGGRGRRRAIRRDTGRADGGKMKYADGGKMKYQDGGVKYWEPGMPGRPKPGMKGPPPKPVEGDYTGPEKISKPVTEFGAGYRSKERAKAEEGYPKGGQTTVPQSTSRKKYQGLGAWYKAK